MRTCATYFESSDSICGKPCSSLRLTARPQRFSSTQQSMARFGSPART